MAKLNQRNGFTLVELLVVVAILGVLAAVGITTFSGFINKSKINASKANHKQVFNLVAAKSMKCTLGEESVKYLDINGETQEASCPIGIDAFVSIMNQNLYSLNINDILIWITRLSIFLNLFDAVSQSLAILATQFFPLLDSSFIFSFELDWS